MDASNQVKCYIEPDVLMAVDTYRAQLRGQGITITRSRLVNTALLHYLGHVRDPRPADDPEQDPSLLDAGNGKGAADA